MANRQERRALRGAQWGVKTVYGDGTVAVRAFASLDEAKRLKDALLAVARAEPGVIADVRILAVDELAAEVMRPGVVRS